MRTLIYKRTHTGDPDPKTGVFGNNDCMGSFRGRQFDAVIGVGGIGPEPRRHGLAGKLNWVGISPIDDGRDHGSRGPQVRFRHFWHCGKEGPLLREKYPALASRVLDKNVRTFMHSPSLAGGCLDHEVKKILRLAEDAPRSKQIVRQLIKNKTASACVPRPKIHVCGTRQPR